MSDQSIPAFTPCRLAHRTGPLKAGAPVVTLEACKRDSHAEHVRVVDSKGREYSVSSYSVGTMLPEEIEPWQREVQ